MRNAGREVNDMDICHGELEVVDIYNGYTNNIENLSNT